MSRMLFVLASGVLGGILGLSGCASMSVEQRTAFCTNTDWHRYGLNDGTLGIRSSERADIIADCAEVGHPVDVTAYQAGRAEGLREYCTVENGYDVGYSGRRYENVCPPELAGDFLQGYAQGRDDRPSYAVYPSIGIGIGSGGVRTGVGIGIGGYYNDRCYYRDPFPCSWRRPWGYRWPYYRYPYYHPRYRGSHYPKKDQPSSDGGLSHPPPDPQTRPVPQDSRGRYRLDWLDEESGRSSSAEAPRARPIPQDSRGRQRLDWLNEEGGRSSATQAPRSRPVPQDSRGRQRLDWQK